MKRERATEMLDNLDAGSRPLDLVDEVYVFGSYARGALQPGDLDVSVLHRTDTEFTEHVVGALTYGRDPMAGMKRASKAASAASSSSSTRTTASPKAPSRGCCRSGATPAPQQRHGYRG
ncbi:nucleotidyltransferase domain-containing protein [Streptomyces sp. B21-101]|uniref:nucleotidyltransferase domain-containing protein n=1 Tax=Streptomyces sp. B21-101 TaxID=3039415 RepID=UPI002FF3388F